MKNQKAIKKFLEERLNSEEAEREAENAMYGRFMIEVKDEAVEKFNIPEKDYIELDSLAMSL